VVEAALTLADRGGLDAVTMQSVASALGVTPMAIYRHVADKAALLDGLVGRLLMEVGRPEPELPPREQLLAMARALREVGGRHPAVFPLLLTRPAATPAALEVRESVLRALELDGIPAERAAQLERLISTAVLGFVASEVAGRFRDHTSRVVDEDFERLLEMLDGFVDGDAGGRVPHPGGG